MATKLAQLTSLVNSPANFSCAYNDGMDRRALLRALIDERYHANVAEFARAIKKAPAQVHQWLSGNRALGNAGARDIEMRLNLGLGYFDHGRWNTDEPQPTAPGPTGAAAASIGALMSRASPRSRTILDRIAQAADAGRLTDADIELLDQIAERFARQE